MTKLSHLDDKGQARMVDVSDKAVTERTAIAAGFVKMKAETLALIEKGEAKKGDVLATARIAGIMAAKKTHELIPLCHPLMITKANVHFTASHDPAGIAVVAEVKVSGQTGVEMEALTAVSVACLTIYDMLKAADKGMIIKPEGYSMEGMPKNMRMIMPDTSIIFSRQSVYSSGILNLLYKIEFRQPLFLKDDYPYFREFYKKLFDLLNEKFVYKKD